VSGAVDFGALLPHLEAAFAEVAARALGLDPVEVERRLEEPPTPYQGAYLGLLAARGAIQVGVASDEAGCQALSRGLLGLPEGEPPLCAAELADALCEIANIVAGGFKGRVRETTGSLAMGLPVFFRGPAQPTDHTAVRVAVLRAGAVRVALLLMHPKAGKEG